MPTKFIDAEQNITVVHYLRMLRNSFNTRGVVFERDGKNNAALKLCELHVARLQMIEELFVSGHGEKTKITCDTCDQRTTCSSAYDMYNTDGDCIMEK
jgi:hypothetical protein